MMWIWIANVLLCLMFFALSIIGWHQREHFFAVLNMMGGLLVAGFEGFAHFGRADKLALLLVVVPIGLIFLSDFVLVLWDIRSEKANTDSQRVRNRLTNVVVPECFMIEDEARLHKEFDRQKGLLEADRARALHMWKQGNAAFAKAHYEVAQQRYDQAARWVPCSTCFSNLAAALLLQNQFEAAAIKCEVALQLDQENYEAWMNRGLALLMADQFSQAIDCFDRGARLQPTRCESYLCKANALRKLGQWQAAIELCDTVLQIDMARVEAWYIKGLCLNRLSRPAEAQLCFDRAIALQPDDYHAHLNRGNALLHMGKYAEAIGSYNQSLRLCPKCLEAMNNRGIALGKIGNLRDAIRNYEKALKLNPGYHEAWLNLGVAHDVRNERAQALESYKKFLQLAPPRMQKRIELIRRRVEELANNTSIAEEDAAAPFRAAAELQARP